MPDARILVVEDDAIIGRHIQAILKKNSYEICGVVTSGMEAVKTAFEQRPDLILMDIQLEGSLDGIMAAETIQASANVPVIYLTAYADGQTLQRAKITDPFGYVLKPFDERALITNVVMALNKHGLERRLRESEEQFRTLVETQGEGLGILDPDETYIFANPAMGAIMGVAHDALAGHTLLEFMSPESRKIEQAENEKRRQGLKTIYELHILRLDGQQRTLSVTATPWFKDHTFAGTFSLCQDITERKRVETAEKEQRAMAEALTDTAAALTSSLALDVVLDRILSNVGRVVPHLEANIMLIDGKQVRIVRGSGEPGATRTEVLGPVSRWEVLGFMHSILAGGGPAVIADVANSGLDQVFPMSDSVHSAVVAPIRIKNQTMGVVNLGSALPTDFSKDTVDRLQVFANQAAIAIENARLFEEAQRRARYLAILNQVTQAAINSTDLYATLTNIARILADLYKCDGVYISIWDEAGQVTIPAAAYGFVPKDFGPDMHYPGELTLTSSALMFGRPIIVDDIQSSNHIDPGLRAKMSLQSAMSIPLIAGDQKLGGIVVGFKEPHTFLEEDVTQGQEIAGQVALAITKLRLYAEIQRLAIVDELTGLYNRRGIFELGRQQVDLAHRTGTPLSMVWLDIDQFKSINDHYGHHIGDEIISVLADRCRNNLKKRDLVGRYGGEGGDELIILLPETSLEAALEIAERLRVVIMKSPIATHEGKINVTVSQGVTALRGVTEDFMELLNRADKTMYAAKAAGRNCVLMQAWYLPCSLTPDGGLNKSPPCMLPNIVNPIKNTLTCWSMTPPSPT